MNSYKCRNGYCAGCRDPDCPANALDPEEKEMIESRAAFEEDRRYDEWRDEHD